MFNSLKNMEMNYNKNAKLDTNDIKKKYDCELPSAMKDKKMIKIGEGKRANVYLVKFPNKHKYAIKPLDLGKYDSFNANKKMDLKTRYKKYNEWREIENYKILSLEKKLRWVVRLYDVIMKKPYAYLIMEFMPCGTLKANIDSNFFKSKFLCTTFLLQMNKIFEECKEIKFIHGDLHLENIMRKGKCWKVLDFSRSQFCTPEFAFDDCQIKLDNQYDKKYFYGMLLNYVDKTTILGELIHDTWGNRPKPIFNNINILMNYKEINNF